MESPRNHTSERVIKPPPTRIKCLNLLARFRVRKQDCIAASVAQHIHAVRAAQALDRRTHQRQPVEQLFGTTTEVPTQHTSSDLSSGAHERRRLVQQQVTYGATSPSKREVSCQTTDDLGRNVDTLPSQAHHALRDAHVDLVTHRMKTTRCPVSHMGSCAVMCPPSAMTRFSMSCFAVVARSSIASTYRVARSGTAAVFPAAVALRQPSRTTSLCLNALPGSSRRAPAAVALPSTITLSPASEPPTGCACVRLRRLR
ncbi:hypothetical protein MTO96_018210 [Rhipicephalus appendiculatus]